MPDDFVIDSLKVVGKLGCLELSFLISREEMRDGVTLTRFSKFFNEMRFALWYGREHLAEQSMSRDEEAIEKEIQDKGLNAPRLTPDHIDSVIASEQYYQPADTTLTICVLTLQNGFNVIGESAAASPANFDADLGQRIARNKAREKIWALEGYLLRQREFERENR